MALSYMIASDIHGDAESVEALLRRFDAERETVRMAGAISGCCFWEICSITDPAIRSPYAIRRRRRRQS